MCIQFLPLTIMNMIIIGHVTNFQSEVGIITGFTASLLLLLGLIITFISIIVLLLRIKAKLTFFPSKKRGRLSHDHMTIIELHANRRFYFAFKNCCISGYLEAKYTVMHAGLP